MGNPFIQSYLVSDWFGKGIFLALYALSALTWIVIAEKGILLWNVRKISRSFATLFSDIKEDPLSVQLARAKSPQWIPFPDPFFEVYKTLKGHVLMLLQRGPSLSPADLELVQKEMASQGAIYLRKLNQRLFILSTAVALAPFLGLLGTVWGILITFSDLSGGAMAAGNAAMLSGLSMALATTVLGLLIAIPAQVGVNWIRNAQREYRGELDHFSQRLLTAIELKYRP